MAEAKSSDEFAAVDDQIPWHQILKYQARSYVYLFRRRWWRLTPWWTRQEDCRCIFRGRRQQVYCLAHCIESLGFTREELEAAEHSASREADDA